MVDAVSSTMREDRKDPTRLTYLVQRVDGTFGENKDQLQIGSLTFVNQHGEVEVAQQIVASWQTSDHTFE